MSDTIFALSSGSPPAAIGVIRISGPNAVSALKQLSGDLPEARRAGVRNLRDSEGRVLDRVLVIWFDGPKTATGEDVAEIHCHGGRAVVSALEAALSDASGLRKADPGEFTRRAFANGVIDLAEAEGLADLLSAETELQRRAAQASAGGGLSRKVDGWRDRLLHLSAQVEAALDFSDEDDVEALPAGFAEQTSELAQDIRSALNAPRAERLRDGIRVVLGGPPNSGKSSLFNALLDEGAAIVSAEAGTTRDVIERPIAFAGIPFILIDTAGLREGGAGEIETIGIGRAREEFERADIILWLGPEGEGPPGSLEVAAKSDIAGHEKDSAIYSVSSATGSGVADLIAGLIERAQQILPKPGLAAFNERQAETLVAALDGIDGISASTDPLICGERLRLARRALDRLLGRHSTEDVLDALFGRFCIGK